MGSSVACTIHCKHRIAVMLYVYLRNMVCFGYVIANALSEGDNKLKKNVKKGTAIPLQVWTGPEGSRSLRLPDCKAVGT